MNLLHYNDGKGKYQSHEISVKDDDTFYNQEYDVFNHDIFDITGYGETKKEALKDFKKKFEYIMNELKAFESLLFDTDVIENNIIQVDCFKNEIK